MGVKTRERSGLVLDHRSKNPAGRLGLCETFMDRCGLDSTKSDGAMAWIKTKATINPGLVYMLKSRCLR